METTSWQSVMSYFTLDVILILSILIVIFATLSIISALMETRTPQGSVAWILSLFYFPWVAVPVYWIFGRSRFRGYIDMNDVYPKAILEEKVAEIKLYLQQNNISITSFLEKDGLPDAEFFSYFLGGNQTKLLLNGDEAYGAMFDAMPQRSISWFNSILFVMTPRTRK
jgi:cardiolipin synthase A/B